MIEKSRVKSTALFESLSGAYYSVMHLERALVARFEEAGALDEASEHKRAADRAQELAEAAEKYRQDAGAS